MKKLKLLKFQLLLFLVLSLVHLFSSVSLAQSTTEVPLYCIGAACSSSGPSSVVIPNKPSPSPIQSSPCMSESSQSGNFFSNLFSSIFNFFFNPNKNPDPCSVSNNIPRMSEQPSSLQTTPGLIQFISHITAQVAGQDMSITVGKPANIQNGDVLVAMVGSDYAHVDSTPTGWTLIRQDVKNEGHLDDLAMQSYYKVVSGGEQESYTWNLVTQRKDTPSDHQPLIAVDIYAFRGVDTNNPVFSNSVHSETRDENIIECPSVKGVSGGMLLCAYIGDDPGTLQAPATMTQTSNFEIGGGEGDVYAAAYESITSGSDTGPRNASWNNPSNKNGSDFAHAIVLKPLKN